MQFGPYNQSQLANIATLLIAVLSITLLTGASGQISLGQGAIMAVGGYGSALLVTKLGLSMWLAFFLAIFISALFGLFLGLAAARLSGPYLAGTTLVMALAIPSIAVRFESFFSGDIGLSVDYGYPPNWLTNLIGEISIEEWSLYVALPFAALALFARGQTIAQSAGSLLGDTKYEFGIHPDGRVLIIDEMHTPDSSRFWELKSYDQRLKDGKEPESLDKEPIRFALDAIGYRGDGPPPVLDPAVISATTSRYIQAFERITGTSFVAGEYPVQQRLATSLQKASLI